ncbi:hypothetical protein THAOC_23013 [Thalassiosira oceanica]|uniref:Uncharacterized protein n=1 Tax=Thalassiosira oceanica TaxID=159749 RepID=K0RT16_THAOC|nr:hypothetical protein THAOC_23013 [Thalassiosira oceanica]|eukprot:EJK56993.1 hypothetical protein THAOC_23013 [Thalassiosira oceanica]
MINEVMKRGPSMTPTKYSDNDIAVRRHATFCQTLEAELDHALRASGLDEFGIEYDRPLPMSAARRPSAHHATQNAAVMEEHTTIKNTPTELLLKGLHPFDKTNPPIREVESRAWLDKATTELRNILDAVDPTHVGFEVEDTNVAAHHNLEEAAILPFMGMYIGDYAKPHSSPARHCQYLIMSSRGFGPASCAPPTRVVTREADELNGAGAEKPCDDAALQSSSYEESLKRVDDKLQDILEKVRTIIAEALGERKAHRDDDLAVLPAKPVEPSTRAILPSTPVKAPTIRSSNRASPSSKRATGGTGNFRGGYQPDETEGYVYWAAFLDDLRAPRSDRGSRGFPSPKKGARGPPQRDKRHWANPSYRVALPINDSEPPSQHLWNNHDGPGINVMPLAPWVYGNTTMGTGLILLC